MQTKLKVSEPGDAQEREADATAARVAQGRPAAVSRKASSHERQPAAQRAVASQQPEVRRKPADDKKAAAPAVMRKPADEQKSAAPGVMRKAADDKKAAAPGVMRKAAEEKPAASGGKANVQREATEAGQAAQSASLSESAEAAVASKGQGKPLDEAVRAPIEDGLGADLSGVRVHDDAAAQASAASLQARAFTHGSDIWVGPGESASNLELMAHEATHVVQQGAAGPSVQRKAQALPAKKPAGPDPGTEIDHKNHKIKLPVLQVPKEGNKKPGSPGVPVIPATNFTLPNKKTERGDQRKTWLDEIKGPGINSKVDQMLAKGQPYERDGKKVYFVKVKSASQYIVGTPQQIKEQVKLPNWTREGKPSRYDVDHVTELQLGGKDQKRNYQLLFYQANRSSGSQIKSELANRISVGVSGEVGKGQAWPKPPDPDDVRQEYDITFAKVEAKLTLEKGGDDFYSFEEVQDEGKHLEGLQVLKPSEANAANLLGSKAQLVIYLTESAGKPHHVKSAGTDKWNVADTKDWHTPGFKLKSINYTPGKSGTLKGSAYEGDVDHPTIRGGLIDDVELDEVDGLEYTVRARASTIRARVRNAIAAKKASPIELFDAGLDDGGLGARGVLRPTLPFLRKGLEIDIAIAGNDVTLSTTFTAGDLALPGPIQVTQAALTLSAGTRGLSLTGEATLVMEGVATGRIRGVVGTSGGLELEGQIDFDSKLFNPARVSVAYRNGEFSGAGELGVAAGKIRGIKSGHVSASYDKGVFAAAGQVVPTIPGVENVNLSLRHSEQEGFTIAGDATLAKLPGIQSGSVSIVVAKPPGAEDWKVKAHGSAVPAIPGLNTALDVLYDDGALTITGSAQYARGMMSGSLAMGVTNRALDAEGKPTDALSDKMRVYGGGNVTVKLAPWLQGTAGVRLLPNGEIELTGRIALPSTLDIFPQKSLKKNLFSLNIDIPILGFAVAGQRVGIFATIGGGLDLSASIGPGQLRDLALEVTYNPAHEDQTRISGGAKLVIPAQAGLRLAIHGALGAGIPIVSATLGLEVGAALGLEGAAEASVNVAWTPTTGIALDALGELYVQPKFKFDLTGFLNVEADLWITTINLYEKRWQLASFELGPDLRFGVKFPVHYREGQPFDISWDQVVFDVPHVDTDELLSSVIQKIV